MTNGYYYDGWAAIREAFPAATYDYVYELDPSGSLQGAGVPRHSAPGATAGTIGGLLAASFGGSPAPATVFYAYDANGNVTELVGTNGTTIAAHTYDQFGNTITQTGTPAAANPFRFSTKYLDAETDLYYYGPSVLQAGVREVGEPRSRRRSGWRQRARIHSQCARRPV